MNIPTLPGVTARTLTTRRLTTRVLFAGEEDGVPVLFLHGNLSSATWWEETLLALPQGYWGIAPDQRGFGDADPRRKIDARRGMGDLVEDALALLDHLGINRAHMVGNSMGGNVIWRVLADAPDQILSATLPGPGSPFGFGGTKDAQGTPCFEDYAGSGAGLFSPRLVQRIQEEDRGLGSRFSPRRALRDLVYKPPFIPEREDVMVEALLAVHISPQDLPGDIVASPNYPFYAPGVWGAANALSPKCAGDIQRLYAARPKPSILWVRGSHDIAISDHAASDPGTFGLMGLIEGYPGAAVFPPQPMVSQIRAALDRYTEQGGRYEEVIIEDSGHVPFIEQPSAFNEVFHRFLGRRRELTSG
jgi:pimeloyl-ACP methyl ester carboxylesterase